MPNFDHDRHGRGLHSGKSSGSKWMTRDPLTVGPDASVGEALDRMLSVGFRHLPVMEGHTVVCVVSMRDLARSIAKG